MKYSVYFAGFAFLLVALSSSALGAGEKVVLVSHGGMGNPFWAVVFNGAKAAAKDLNVDLKILFPDKDGDQPGTTQKLSEAISTHPDGLAVTLATSAHCEFIKEARKKDIPIIVYNARAVKKSNNCPYQAYVGMDEYLAGKISAERAWDSGKIKGRVMVGLTEAGHAGLQARAKGVEDVLKKKGVKVDIMDLGNDPSAVPARVSSYYKRHQANLSGMFIPAPNGMHPILRMMEEDQKGIGRRYASAFDLTPLIIRGIEKGYVDHTIDQQPYLQGYYTVAQLTHAIRGKFNPMDMNTGVGIVEKSNAQAVLKLVKRRIR